jgi:glucokinase
MSKKMVSIYNGHTIIPRDNITAATVAQAADRGDKLAQAIYRRCGEKLGLCLSILIDILNPQAIVLGSIFTRSKHLLLDSMKQAIEKEALPCSVGCCQILSAELGESIGDYAAIATALEE